jgi:hypothetical protein
MEIGTKMKEEKKRKEKREEGETESVRSNNGRNGRGEGKPMQKERASWTQEHSTDGPE